MYDLVNTLSSQTGLSSDLVHKGLGTLLSFLKDQLGEETFDKIRAAVPGATEAADRFESAPEASQGQGGLMGMFAGLAGKLLGGRAGEVTKLLESFSKLGFNPEQVESFLPKALELIKSYLPPGLIDEIMAKLPALAKLVGGGEK